MSTRTSLSQCSVAQVDGGFLPPVNTHCALHCVPCPEGRKMTIYLLRKPGFNGDETDYRAQCFNLLFDSQNVILLLLIVRNNPLPNKRVRPSIVDTIYYAFWTPLALTWLLIKKVSTTMSAAVVFVKGSSKPTASSRALIPYPWNYHVPGPATGAARDSALIFSPKMEEFWT